MAIDGKFLFSNSIYDTDNRYYLKPYSYDGAFCITPRNVAIQIETYETHL